MDQLEKILEAEDSNFTLNEVIELIEFLNDEKNLTLEETKEIINAADPTQPEVDKEQEDIHEQSTN